MQWLALVKTMFMWIGVLCSFLIVILYVLYRLTPDWYGPETEFERVTSPNNRFVAIVTTQEVMGAFGTGHTRIYIGNSGYSFSKNPEKFEMVLKGSGNMKWKTESTLEITRYFGEVNYYLPRVFLGSEKTDEVMIKLVFQ